MSVPVYEDDGSTNPFPPAIASDEWVAYHGSSAAYSDGIDVEGLGHRGVPFWFDGVLALGGLYEALAWHGLSPAGFAVLRTWSIDADSRNTRVKLVYLAETFQRACQFAEFAGGESVRAITAALDDLERFVQDRSVREEHRQQLVRGLQQMGFDIGAPREARQAWPRPAPGVSPAGYAGTMSDALDLLDDEEEVARRASAFTALRSGIESISRDHRPVVYAARLNSELLEDGQYSPAMGIGVVHIPPRDLVGRCLLDPGRTTAGGANAGLDLSAWLDLCSRWAARFGSARDGGEQLHD